MRQLMGTVLVGLLTVAGTATAAPEMRCRLGGAYIKVYGKTEVEQREVCAQQGGEYTRYYPIKQQSGSGPRQEGFKGSIGQRPGIR